ncbi:MAG TPA: TldD/PmbA family protein [Thermoanaerobaculia bacterium]|nr:TldD/PmbA family protein [Thermoanaerobaculia bacterium]
MSDWKSLCERVLADLRRRGARYADIRHSVITDENVRVRNGSVESLHAGLDHAIGVRVLVGDGWGFAGDSEVSAEALERTATRALEVAAASHIAASTRVVLSDVAPAIASWSSTYVIDPFSIPAQKKIEVLLAATEAMRGDDRIHQVSGEISCYRMDKIFASSIGSYIEQSSTEMGAGLEAIALDGPEFQRRSYPTSVGGDYQARGWEFIEELDLLGNAPRIRDEALALLVAPKAPAGNFDLLIGSSQLALQVHESCGHPTELDRALGYEISLAGGSFLQPPMLGQLQYGAPIVNLVADATIPSSIGSFGFDDEGVPAQRFHLVENGMFVNYLTSRDTAPVVGKTSNGTVRAESANRIPIIRMTNINLEPGDSSFQDVLADTKRGILIDTNKSWSIDDLRLNFQFSCEIGYEIENGQIGRILKNPIYTGSTPRFWNSCDAICGAETWRVWGLPNCGKGDPMQTMRVAHGAPVARFRGVEMA